MKPILRLFIAVLCTMVLEGCNTPRIPGANRDLIAFLQIGHTTRQETILKLGQPSASFEQEHILTYRLGQDPKQGYYIVTPRPVLPWQCVRFSLVLVFDSAGVLQKQSLVPVD